MQYTFQEYTIFDTLPKRVMKNTNNIMNIYDRISDYLTITEIDNLIEESIETFKTQDIEFTGEVSFSQVTKVFDIETLAGKNLIKENGSTVEVGNSFDSLKLFTTDNVKVYKLGTLLGTIAYEDSLNDLFKNVSYTTDADSVDLVFTKNNDLTTTIILPVVTTSKAGIITGAQFNMIRASYKSVGILNATTSEPLKLRFGNNGGYNFDLELRKATPTLSGIMSAGDKAKLDSLDFISVKKVSTSQDLVIELYTENSEYGSNASGHLNLDGTTIEIWDGYNLLQKTLSGYYIADFIYNDNDEGYIKLQNLDATGTDSIYSIYTSDGIVIKVKNSSGIHSITGYVVKIQ